MARHEQDREDLLREAVALVERAELQAAGETATVVVGFRRDGAVSVYFGADPAYHFNTSGELRRAFVEGQLWKAEQGKLVAMTRSRGPVEVRLESTELTDEARLAVLGTLRERLRLLEQDLRNQVSYTLVGQAPPEANVLARIQGWLAALPDTIPVAARPNVG